MVHRSNYIFSLIILLLSWMNVSAQTGFTINESLTGDQAGELVLGGNAKLTGGVEDNMGDGWLRLTETVINQYGYAVINKRFPSSLGVEMDFEFAIWGGSGADGFSIFLFDARYDPDLPEDDPYKFKIGGRGGGLGYAMRISGTTNEPGLTGGYIGFGIDEYGNYTVSTEGKVGGVAAERLPSTAGIGVRGSETSGYEWLGGNTDLGNLLGSGFTLDYKGTATVRPSPEVYYRRVFLIIDPVYVNGYITHYELSAKLQVHPDADPVLILDKIKINEVPPDYLKVGFAAVTGGSTHIHEVRNLNITTPADLWVRKTVDKTEARVTDELVYTIKVMNQFALQADHLEVKDLLPVHFQVESITFDNGGNPDTKIVSGWEPGGINLDHVIMDMAPVSEATFEVRGRVTDVPDNNLLVNTVTFDVTAQTGFSDTKKENNIATATTFIIKPEITVQNETFGMRIGLPLENMNVLDNDRVDGDLVDLQAFDLSVVTPAQPIDGGGVPYLDVSTGDVILPSDMGLGNYEITYRICERINPNNCQVGVVSVRIDPNVVLAIGDDFGTYREGQGSTTASVLDNDTWNDLTLDPQKVVFSWMSEAPVGVVLHQDGTMEITSLAKDGDYIVTYAICDVGHITNCSEAEVIFRVRNFVAAQDDYYELLIDRANVTTPTSVLDNDIAEGLSGSISELRLIPGTSSHPDMRMHADGTITLPKGTKVGRYTYSYTVCEVIRPSNCQQATAIIDIKAKDLFIPNIITPNGDGVNDYMEIVGYEFYDKMELMVFTSMGIEVFRDNDYQNNWNARGLDDDVYYYAVYLKKDGYTTFIRRGYVLVKRR